MLFAEDRTRPIRGNDRRDRKPRRARNHLRVVPGRLLAFLLENRVRLLVYLCFFCRAQLTRIAALRGTSLCVPCVRLVLDGKAATR
jgi:hypothetical protein